MMIGADDFERDIPLEFPQRQRCMSFGIVFAEFISVTECRPGEKVQCAHLGSDQTLDMAAEMRLAGWTPVDHDSSVVASSLSWAFRTPDAPPSTSSHAARPAASSTSSTTIIPRGTAPRYAPWGSDDSRIVAIAGGAEKVGAVRAVLRPVVQLAHWLD